MELSGGNIFCADHLCLWSAKTSFPFKLSGHFVTNSVTLDGVLKRDVPQSHDPNPSIPRNLPGLSIPVRVWNRNESQIISDRVCVYQTPGFDLDLFGLRQRSYIRPCPIPPMSLFLVSSNYVKLGPSHQLRYSTPTQRRSHGSRVYPGLRSS